MISWIFEMLRKAALELSEEAWVERPTCEKPVSSFKMYEIVNGILYNHIICPEF